MRSAACRFPLDPAPEGRGREQPSAKGRAGAGWGVGVRGGSVG